MILNGLDYMRSVCCDQSGETCSAVAEVPSTCYTYSCYRAVKRVKKSCAGYFASDSFSATSLEAVTTIEQECSKMAVANPPFYAPKLLQFAALGARVVDDPCGAVVTDGITATSDVADFSGFGIGVTLMAPPGKVLEIQFQEVTFPKPLQVRHAAVIF